MQSVKPMFRLLGLMLILASLVGCVDSTPKTPWNSLQPDYSQHYVRAPNVTDQLRRATEKAHWEGKNVLIIMGGKWCGWCNRLDKFLTERNEVAQKLLGDFVVFKVQVDPNNNVPADEIAALPKFKGVPHFYVLDDEGELVKSISNGFFVRGSEYDEKAFRDLSMVYRAW